MTKSQCHHILRQLISQVSGHTEHTHLSDITIPFNLSTICGFTISMFSVLSSQNCALPHIEILPMVREKNLLIGLSCNT